MENLEFFCVKGVMRLINRIWRQCNAEFNNTIPKPKQKPKSTQQIPKFETKNVHVRI